MQGLLPQVGRPCRAKCRCRPATTHAAAAPPARPPTPVPQVRSLYRGMSPQLVGGALETGVNYAVYQAMLNLTQVSVALEVLWGLMLLGHLSADREGWEQSLPRRGHGPTQPLPSPPDPHARHHHPTTPHTYHQGPALALPEAVAVPLSAATAGIVLSFVLSPAELVKVRCAAAPARLVLGCWPQCCGFGHCVVLLLAAMHGPLAASTCCPEARVRRHCSMALPLLPLSSQPSHPAPPAAPSHLAVSQCRLQMGGTERYHTYNGPIDCLRQTVRTEGLRGLTRGLGGTMARECPGNAICELAGGRMGDCSELADPRYALRLEKRQLGRVPGNGTNLSLHCVSPKPIHPARRLQHVPPAAPLAAGQAARRRSSRQQQ